MRTAIGLLLVALALAGHSQSSIAQFPPGQSRFLGVNLLPSSTSPPVITAPPLSTNQTVAQFRASTAKEFIRKAWQPEYRSVDGQMYDLQPLAEYFLWLTDLPVNAENTAMLKNQTRPLPNWTLVYGRIAQLTDHNGIFLWQYQQPEMVLNPKLVCLRNYPLEKTLVDGDVVVAFAKSEGPYSYVDSLRSKSTVNSYDYGKPVTKQEVDLFIQRKSALAKSVQAQTNSFPAQGKH
jgi:hypothetical protein